MTYTPLKHIVFVPGPPWGHLRPGLKTAVRIVEKFPDVFISLFVYHTEVSRAIKYLSTQPSTHSKRIKIVTATIGGEELTIAGSSGKEVEMIICFEKSFKLWITNEIQHPSTIQFEGRSVHEPSLIIEDVFGGGVAMMCKDVHKLPIVAWWLMPAASLINTKLGEGLSLADVGTSDKIGQCDTQSGVRLAKGCEIHPKDASDELVYIPGIPPHYKWELATQDVPFLQPLMEHLLGRWNTLIKNVDAIVCCTNFEFESITAASFSKFFKATPYFIGPSVDLAPPHQPDPESPVTQFLDRAYTEKGAHSVIYVAFGTVFFPPESSISHLIAALDEIPKAGFKFIFALSSGRARLDQSWMDAHIQAGNAIFPEWTNQTAVLEHPAIHYFLSHGGWNSSTEAIVRGVPMIFWPIAGDQPLNAIQIASVHDCGFELLQVRTGPAKSTAYRNGTEVKIFGTDDAIREEMRGILESSKGSKGEHQRTNMKLLGQIVAESLAPGGSGDIGLEKLGKALGLV